MNPMHETRRRDDAEFAASIAGSSSEAPVETALRTDEQVLARVTDGIYRQPGSAIRELLSNAYDADARQVVIKTDRPRFHTLSVEDDGMGMTPAVLAHLLYHIGGSAKRSPEGVALGLTHEEDPTRSPSGRRLIGKIGIGLFSVAQLTYRFQIITKTVGDPFRTIALVVLRQNSDESAPPTDKQGGYEAGRVTIWREPAADTASHGTTIVLTDVRPPTRNTLQSRDLWKVIDAASSLDPADRRNSRPPAYHIGRVSAEDPDVFEGDADAYDSLPWEHNDRPEIAFKKLVKAVWEHQGTPNPQLERIFDYYLGMVWQLSLAIPAPYVSGNPFDLPLRDNLYLFDMPQSSSAPPAEFELANDETIRMTKSIGLASDDGKDFRVFIDDLQLARPLRFTDLPVTNHAVKRPILFVGRCRDEFDGVPQEFSGGPLEFEAYLMWAPKIAPTEHRGVLVRVHGSSGTLFDSTFLQYQVSEQTRLKQISCEIFVLEGLEAALNIDRESLNYAHPHAVYITQWLHASLRRVATVQKRIAAEIRQDIRETAKAAQEKALLRIATQAWQDESDDPGAQPPPIEFTDEEDPIPAEPGTYRFRRIPIFGANTSGGKRRRHPDKSAERKLATIVQLLSAYGMLDSLADQQQERFLAGMHKILKVSDQ